MRTSPRRIALLTVHALTVMTMALHSAGAGQDAQVRLAPAPAPDSPETMWPEWNEPVLMPRGLQAGKLSTAGAQRGISGDTTAVNNWALGLPADPEAERLLGLAIGMGYASVPNVYVAQQLLRRNPVEWGRILIEGQRVQKIRILGLKILEQQAQPQQAQPQQAQPQQAQTQQAQTQQAQTHSARQQLARRWLTLYGLQLDAALLSAAKVKVSGWTLDPASREWIKAKSGRLTTTQLRALERQWPELALQRFIQEPDWSPAPATAAGRKEVEALRAALNSGELRASAPLMMRARTVDPALSLQLANLLRARLLKEGQYAPAVILGAADLRLGQRLEWLEPGVRAMHLPSALRACEISAPASQERLGQMQQSVARQGCELIHQVSGSAIPGRVTAWKTKLKPGSKAWVDQSRANWPALKAQYPELNWPALVSRPK